MSCEVDFFNSHRWTITALSLRHRWDFHGLVRVDMMALGTSFK